MIKPPTDNLYKFIAVCGIVVFVSGIYLYANALIRHSDYVLHMHEVAVEEIKWRDAQEKIKRDKVEDSSSKVENVFTFDWLELESKHKTIISRIVLQGIFASVLIFLGIGISWRGCKLWYKKVQQFEDRRIAGEVAKLEKELARSREQSDDPAEAQPPEA